MPRFFGYVCAATVKLVVEGAHASDHNALIPFIEDTQARGVGPTTAFADTSYSSGENLVTAADKGVNLMAPTPGTVDPDDLTLANFTFQEDALEVVCCPEGHAPVSQKSNRNGNGRIVRFAAAPVPPASSPTAAPRANTPPRCGLPTRTMHLPSSGLARSPPRSKSATRSAPASRPPTPL